MGASLLDLIRRYSLDERLDANSVKALESIRTGGETKNLYFILKLFAPLAMLQLPRASAFPAANR
jgi:hypothetical protein